MIDPPALDEFERTEGVYLTKQRPLYRTGNAGPGVVLMHEIPGLAPNVLRLAKLISQRGFRVVLPSLFGVDGRAPTGLIDDEELIHMCVSAEFGVFRSNRSSPVVDWLRELCRDLARETGVPWVRSGFA